MDEPGGFEPPQIDSKSIVLPLDDGSMDLAIVNLSKKLPFINPTGGNVNYIANLETSGVNPQSAQRSAQIRNDFSTTCTIGAV